MKLNRRILEKLKETSLTEDWLEPEYDSAQSFYKKARVEDDGNKLYSYDTLVAEIKDGKPIIYNAQSMTTRRHIRDFLLQKGFDYKDVDDAILNFKKLNGGWRPDSIRESADKYTGKELDNVAYWVYNNVNCDSEWDKFTDNELVELISFCCITDKNPGGKAYDDEVFDAAERRPNGDELIKKGQELAKSRLKESYPFTHDMTIYYGTNEDGSDDTGEIEIFVDNREDFPELTDEEIHQAFKDNNCDIWFSDADSRYYMMDIKIKDGYWLTFKEVEDSGTKPHFIIEKTNLKESSVSKDNTKPLQRYAVDIDWETDGDSKAKKDLPKRVAIPDGISDDNVADYLSDEYGWLVNSCSIEESSLNESIYYSIQKADGKGFFVKSDKDLGDIDDKKTLFKILDKLEKNKVLSHDEVEDCEFANLSIERDDAAEFFIKHGIECYNLNESTKTDKSKKPTKRLVMNQGNVYIFEQTKGSKKSYIVGEDIDKDANTIEKVNRYNNQDDAFTDFFERIGINPSNELKESIKKAANSGVLKESKITYSYILSLPGCVPCAYTSDWDEDTAKKEYLENEGSGTDYTVDDIQVEYEEFTTVINEADTGCGAYSKEVKEETIKESGTVWTSETTEDDYDKEELKANEYQEYLNDIKEREPNKPKDFDEWFEDYMVDDSSFQWEMKNEDLKENVVPMIDKQVNGAIFIIGDYNSNYPDFRKSGPGGKVVKDADALMDWLSDEDRVDITYEDNEQLGVTGYDHDGSISGLLYTLPDDPHKILEIALSTNMYDKKDYKDNNELIEDFLYDLGEGNVYTRDIKKPELLVPIVNGFRTGIMESSLKEFEENDPGNFRVYSTDDLNNMESGMPVAVEIGDNINTVLYAGKDGDTYYFYDNSGYTGLFGFSKFYIDKHDKVLITDRVEPAEVESLIKSMNLDKSGI